MYSELGLSQELVDLRVREDMGEEVNVLKHRHSSQQGQGDRAMHTTPEQPSQKDSLGFHINVLFDVDQAQCDLS